MLRQKLDVPGNASRDWQNLFSSSGNARRRLILGLAVRSRMPANEINQHSDYYPMSRVIVSVSMKPNLLLVFLVIALGIVAYDHLFWRPRSVQGASTGPHVLEVSMTSLIRGVPTNGEKATGISCVAGKPNTLCYILTE